MPGFSPYFHFFFSLQQVCRCLCLLQMVVRMLPAAGVRGACKPTHTRAGGSTSRDSAATSPLHWSPSILLLHLYNCNAARHEDPSPPSQAAERKRPEPCARTGGAPSRCVRTWPVEGGPILCVSVFLHIFVRVGPGLQAERCVMWSNRRLFIGNVDSCILS